MVDRCEPAERVLPHLDAAYNLACWLLGDKKNADEAVRKAAARALRDVDAAREDDLKSWFLGIVRNTCHEELRRTHPGFATIEPDAEGAPETDAVVLRRGDPGDLVAIARIELEAARMFPPAVLPRRLARPLPARSVAAAMAQSRVWVADGGSFGLAGFVLFEEIAACLHIAEIDVRPSFGRRGIGTRLLGLVVSIARDRRLSFVTLTTFAHVPWNAPFYARRGFAATSDLAPFPHLAGALAREARRGLTRRVAMVRPTTATAFSRSRC